MLLIPKPTTGHNPVPSVSTYNSHSFLISHPLGVIRCCFPGCMKILCAFLVCPILATLVLYAQIIVLFLYSSPLNHTLNTTSVACMLSIMCVGFSHFCSNNLFACIVIDTYIQYHTIVQPHNNNMRYEGVANQLHTNVFIIRLFAMRGTQMKLYVCRISSAFFVCI